MDEEVHVATRPMPKLMLQRISYTTEQREADEDYNSGAECWLGKRAMVAVGSS